MGESLHNIYRCQITTTHTLLSHFNKVEIKQNHWFTGWFTVSISAPLMLCFKHCVYPGQWVLNSADVHTPGSSQTPQSEALLVYHLYIHPVHHPRTWPSLLLIFIICKTRSIVISLERSSFLQISPVKRDTTIPCVCYNYYLKKTQISFLYTNYTFCV